MSEYLCEEHGRFESLEANPVPDFKSCPECGELAEWVISAPKPKVLSVHCYAAVRGGDTERRPGMLDTRPLAEGATMSEWKATQRHAQQERRHHQLIAKGLKPKRVQVG